MEDKNLRERVDAARPPNQVKRFTHVSERPTRQRVSREQLRFNLAVRRGLRDLPHSVGARPVPVEKKLRFCPEEAEIRVARVDRCDVVEAPTHLRPPL